MTREPKKNGAIEPNVYGEQLMESYFLFFIFIFLLLAIVVGCYTTQWVDGGMK